MVAGLEEGILQELMAARQQKQHLHHHIGELQKDGNIDLPQSNLRDQTQKTF